VAELDLSGQRILIVDDVAFARVTLKKILFNLGNPDILEAQDGLDAEKILNSETNIHFVIADFNMPKSNGLELVKSIRTGSLQAARSLPVAMLTGYSEEHLVSMALALDINAFIIKPVSKASLSRRLKKMLDVSRDTSWLKDQDLYTDVSIIEVEDQKADVEQNPASLKKAKAVQAKTAFKPQTGKGKPAEKFEESDLAGHEDLRSGKFKASDLADIELIRQISAAQGGIAPDLAPALTNTLDQLGGDVGGEGTRRVVTLLGELVESEAISVADATSLLTSQGQSLAASSGFSEPQAAVPDGEEFFVTLDDIPENALLSRELKTQDGSLLLAVGTPLTDQVVTIVRLLNEIGKLSLNVEDVDSEEKSGLYIKLSAAHGVDYSNVQRVAVENLHEGAVLARDIYMRDGRRYAVAGSIITDRLISLLRDLEELGHLDREILVAS